MKGLFKSKPKTPVELVKVTRELLIYANRSNTDTLEKKREDKMSELSKVLLEIRTVLFGSDQSEPNADACEQLTHELFKEDALRLLIVSLPKLAMGPQRDATHVVANLQRQRVDSKLIACTYEHGDVALTYGAVARECIRHQAIAKFTEELLTGHKSTVADFLSKNYDWLLGDILLDRSNSAVMVKYASSLDNMRILMNLLRLFVANQNKPPEIISVLITNRSKLLWFFGDFNIDKVNEQFEADKSLVIREIATLDLNQTLSTCDDGDGETSPS